MSRDFLKRLSYFLFGLGIGIVFLIFFFKKKSQETGVEFCYLPNCRVLKDMRSKSISYSDAVQKMIEEQQLDSAQITQIFFEGDIDFGASDTKSNPCKTYVIEGTIKDKNSILTIKNCKRKVIVEQVKLY